MKGKLDKAAEGCDKSGWDHKTFQLHSAADLKAMVVLRLKALSLLDVLFILIVHGRILLVTLIIFVKPALQCFSGQSML